MIGTGHLWIILGLLLIVLVVYGPGKLPEVGGAIGRGISEFRKSSSGPLKEIKEGAPLSQEPTAQSQQPSSAEGETLPLSSSASPDRKTSDRA